MPAILGTWEAGHLWAVNRKTKQLHIDRSPVNPDLSDQALMPYGQRIEFTNGYDKLSNVAYWQAFWLLPLPPDACRYLFLQYQCVFFGLYDRTTRELHYVNAGHNDPLLLLDDGSASQPLKDGTIMLGVMEELPMLNVGHLVVPPHSLLLTYTDGLTEVFDADQNEFGEDGVLGVLRQNRYAPLATVHAELLREITAFDQAGTGFADDVTILSCRFK